MKILVLYGSQTGNSEGHAQDMCQKYSSDSIQLENMTLDDFLEQGAPYTSIVVVICSSYGVGQAPLGAQRFRQVADEFLKMEAKHLQGLRFALCGLGDSSFTTFFENPKVLAKALCHQGANLIGTIGKADAKKDQEKIVQDWMEQTWLLIHGAAKEEGASEEQLALMSTETLNICKRIIPGFAKEENKIDVSFILAAIALLIAVLVGLSSYYSKQY